MSEFSPCPVRNIERLDRAVFNPIHIDKQGRLKPSLFTHAFAKGCSIQRGCLATTEELVAFFTKMLRDQVGWTWYGVVTASGEGIRAITVDDSKSRGMCLYDTALRENPAHAEIAMSSTPSLQFDEPELRKHLTDAFGGGKIVRPKEYRGGAVLDAMPADLRSRIAV